MAANIYSKRGGTYPALKSILAKAGIEATVPASATQPGYATIEIEGTDYNIPTFTSSHVTPIGQVQVVERTYSISVDNQALTSGVWVDINMDGGAGDDMTGIISHTGTPQVGGCPQVIINLGLGLCSWDA